MSDVQEDATGGSMPREDAPRIPLMIRVPRRLTWDDLIYPPATGKRLHSIVQRWRDRRCVFIDWELGRRLSSDGLICLFEGESGLGKSEAAAAIAAELDLELYRVNLAGLVSKYIGETEQNLHRVLDAAERRGAALVFDEADSLFARRTTDLKGSGELAHNSQVAYLLDHIGRYRGLAMLTTNLGTVIDGAFKRRIDVWVKFEPPGPNERRGIWMLALAKAPARLSDRELEKLAAVDLVGGSIQKVVKEAAFQAAARTRPITLELLREAIEEEFTVLGRLMMPNL